MYTPGGGSATELLGGQPTPCPSYVWRFHAHDRRHVYMCRERVVAGCMCLPCLLAVPTDASASGCDARVLHACVLRYVRGAQWHTRAVDRGAHRDAGGAAGGGSGQGAARRFASRAYGVTSARLCGGVCVAFLARRRWVAVRYCAASRQSACGLFDFETADGA